MVPCKEKIPDRKSTRLTGTLKSALKRGLRILRSLTSKLILNEMAILKKMKAIYISTSELTCFITYYLQENATCTVDIVEVPLNET